MIAPATQYPAGRASLLFLQGNGAGMPFSDSKYLAVGADDNSYRRILSNVRRQDDAATTLLSPDGTRVAYGDGDELVVVDLTTGERTYHPLPGASDATALAWSPDGRRIAYSEMPEWNDRGQARYPREWVELELRTGKVQRHRVSQGVSAVAFAPDGRRAATQDGNEIVITGGPEEHRITGFWLAGPAAWAPSGDRLAVTEVAPTSESLALGQLIFTDNGPEGRDYSLIMETRYVPPCPALGQVRHPFLGWRGEHNANMVFVTCDRDQLAIGEWPFGEDSDRILVRFDDAYGDDERAVYDVQLASGLVASLTVRGDNTPDYGPWPNGVRLLIASGVVVPVLLVAALVFWRRRRVVPRGRETAAT